MCEPLICSILQLSGGLPYVCTSSNIYFDSITNVVTPKITRSLMESIWVITQFVNTINCINFPCKVDAFSFVSIRLTAHQPQWNPSRVVEVNRQLQIYSVKNFDIVSKLKKKILI
jgi:hypothetical protein